MIPGSYLFRRVSDEWLVSRQASILFAISSILVVATIPLFAVAPRIPSHSSFANLFLGMCGCFCSVSVYFLWGGMWHYWARLDCSARTVRRAWFVVLLFGICYGAALYYLLRYSRGEPCPRMEGTEAPTALRAFQRCLLSGWGIFLVFIALTPVFPNAMDRLIHPVTSFVLILIGLLLATGVYQAIKLYRTGMGD